MRKLSPEQKRRINPNQIKPEKSEGGKIECVLMEQKPFQISSPLSVMALLTNTNTHTNTNTNHKNSCVRSCVFNIVSSCGRTATMWTMCELHGCVLLEKKEGTRGSGGQWPETEKTW